MISAKLDLGCSEVMKYELTPYPVSLFEGLYMMNEARKPAFADSIWTLMSSDSGVSLRPKSPAFVLDGGALLYRIKWYLGETFHSIIQRYATYVESKYKTDEMPTIVFDGYETASPKDSSHLRRTGGSVGTSVVINPSNTLTMSRKLFLSCTENKTSFIRMLGTQMEEIGCNILYASGDADFLTAKTAFQSAERKDTVLVGDDTDLLVILVGLVEGKEELNHQLFYCPEKKSTSKKEIKVWDIKRVCNLIPAGITSNILFLHAIHGCDTTSRLPNVRINTLWKLTLDEEFLKCASILKSARSSKADVIEYGLRALAMIYGGLNGESLEVLRTNIFHEKSKLHSEFQDIENYPPTSDSGSLHMQRVYLQVMSWMGINLDPLLFGFSMKDGAMLPVMSTSSVICPEAVLQKMKCGCKSGCCKRCSCRNLGIQCSSNCRNCVENCTNKVNLVEDPE